MGAKGLHQGCHIPNQVFQRMIRQNQQVTKRLLVMRYNPLAQGAQGGIVLLQFHPKIRSGPRQLQS